MGTSSSHTGPTDGPGLLPSWANAGDQDDGSSAPNDGADGADNSSDGDSSDSGANEVASASPSGLWRGAKSAMTRYAGSGGGSSNSGRLRSSASNYVKAKGGSRAAASSAASGKVSARSIGGFLASVSKSGIQNTFQAIGLRDVIGESTEAVFAALVDRLAPSGATKEEAAARSATLEVMAYLYETVIQEGGDIATLETMDEATIESVVEMGVAGYIYNMWLEELGISIEKRAVSETQAVKLEHEVRDYVNSCVKLELNDKSPIDINWDGQEGRRIIDQVYSDAYSVLENTE